MLRESVGYQFDTNRNAAPSSKRVLFFETPLGLTNDSRKKRDTSFLNITTVDFRHDLGFQAGHELIGSFTYYLGEQTSVDMLDLQSFQYEVGGVFKNRIANLTATFYATHMFLSRETFLRTQGGRFQLDRNFYKWDVYASCNIERQDYSNITEYDSEKERKGPQLALHMGARYLLTPSMRVAMDIGYVNKNAEEGYNAYDELQLQASHTWILGKGQFLINALSFWIDYYDEPDVAIAGRYRRDKLLRYRVTYGAPLETLGIGKLLPKFFKDITLSVSYEYFRDLSTITNFTYTNHKFQGLLTKTWEF